MCSTFADAVCDGFKALTDCDNEGGGERGAIYPFPTEILGLEASVGGNLKEVGGQH